MAHFVTLLGLFSRKPDISVTFTYRSKPPYRRNLPKNERTSLLRPSAFFYYTVRC